MVRWDEFAALVALAAVPFMLSGSAAALAQFIGRQALRFFWPSNVQCGTLCWEDIPDGLVRPEGDKVDFVEHESGSCLVSTYGKVFENAWTDPKRMGKQVAKPADLETGTTYLRTDLKAIRALMLVTAAFGSRDPQCFTFEKVGKTMTAHCDLGSEEMTSLNGSSHTKDEARLLLEGYPPFYRASIQLPDGTHVRSPIRDRRDLDRGGWIVHCGLAISGRRFLDPTQFHAMSIVPSDAAADRLWKKTAMKKAVERFGRALDNIQIAMPQEQKLELASKLFADCVDGNVSFDSGTIPCVDDPHTHKRIFDRFDFLGPDGWPIKGDYVSALNADEWRMAMAIFTHKEPLTAEESALLQNSLLPVLQAAFVGLLRVVEYGHSSYCIFTGFDSGQPLPLMPELKGLKYVYLRSCEKDEA